jgi:hypothetical protein
VLELELLQGRQVAADGVVPVSRASCLSPGAACKLHGQPVPCLYWGRKGSFQSASGVWLALGRSRLVLGAGCRAQLLVRAPGACCMCKLAGLSNVQTVL